MASEAEPSRPGPAAASQPGSVDLLISCSCSGRDDVCCVAAESGEKVTESRPPFTETDKGYEPKLVIGSGILKELVRSSVLLEPERLQGVEEDLDRSNATTQLSQ